MMASEVKRIKKRTLPAWMTTMHSQTIQSQNIKKDSDQSDEQGISNLKRQNTDCEALTLKNVEHGVTVDRKTPKTACEIITDSMPMLEVPGCVTYIFQTADCACICEEIISSFDGKSKVPVGFDMEWPVSFRQGSKNETALIQMYFPNDKCYLFQVCGMNPFPKQLARLICDDNLLLLGLNIETDLWKLERDFDIRVKPLLDRGSVIDVGKLANKKLKTSERWDLNGLCKNVLGMQLNKDSEIRCGNWTDIPLSQRQIDYSSADAFAGLVLYQKLNDL